MSQKKAQLILEDGSRFSGYSFGADMPTSGEVVFNTAMTGYPESLTDPSYAGQILVITYPLVGNYGVPGFETENGIPLFFESDKIHVKAVAISDYSFKYSHWNATKSLDQWLKEHNVPGVFGVDTREITKIIREHGVMLGKVAIENAPEPAEFFDPNKENLVAQVSIKKSKRYGEGKYNVILVDCGCKYNIIRCLMRRDATVTVVPWDYDFTHMEYDGVMISNGPGDPQMCGATISNIQKAMNVGKPIFGICMGNHLLSIAAGANTYKLKYGHRSHNQPVLKVGANTAYITSQNHGYAVNPEQLDKDWEPYFVNLNDGTNEGIRHKSKPFFSVQFHPEATSGPVDTEFLFDDFIKMMR
ncbi:MAG: glutamine-hydrolyzing carbamoyl-phosphate synthase small subunit [Prevotellaceae bacterium]|jgi:carbamoyl-phosphate synthase small subunit|nr:glutamine-hydrolyzing carbamoyl-phosphate synthase small subunit [Prevotellaceae bacterium]